MKTKILGILVMTLLIATAFSVNGCVELNDIKSNISIDKGIASSSTTADYKSFFNGHKEGESNILNKDGNWQWAKGAGGTSEDAGQGIVLLSDGSTIVTGYFSGIADFGPYTLTSQSQRYSDVFVAKLSDDGVNQPPNKPSTPSGPANGDAGTTYTYTSSATDPDGDSISYLFDWGDDSNSGWIGPYDSGETISVIHTWQDVGNYDVRVYAKNTNDIESEWSDLLPVGMPKNKAVNINPLFLRFLEQHPSMLPILRYLLRL